MASDPVYSISPDLYEKVALIPEQIADLEEAIEFLLAFYWRNNTPTTAQKALTQEDAWELIRRDSKNGKR